MTEHAQPPAQVIDGEEIAWTAHPRFADIQMKQMLTSYTRQRGPGNRGTALRLHTADCVMTDHRRSTVVDGRRATPDS